MTWSIKQSVIKLIHLKLTLNIFSSTKEINFNIDKLNFEYVKEQ